MWYLLTPDLKTLRIHNFVGYYTFLDQKKLGLVEGTLKSYQAYEKIDSQIPIITIKDDPLDSILMVYMIQVMKETTSMVTSTMGDRPHE